MMTFSTKVKHIITDHASNMMKGYPLPGYEHNEEMEDKYTNIDKEDGEITSIDDYNDS